MCILFAFWGIYLALRGAEGVLALDVVGGERAHVRRELALADVFGGLRAAFVGLGV
jgi:hypothetical protein